jgi:mono/diheme cytochrome c family protein
MVRKTREDQARLWKLVGCLAFISLVVASSSGKSGPQDAGLPAGSGSEVASRSCMSCHGAEPIVQQHLTRAQWQAEVDKMVRWGAEVDSAAKDKLIDYLAAHFAARRTVPPKGGEGALPDGEGVAIVRDSCMSCHGSEPIAQQRLSRAQWTAEVDKMIRWGAEVPSDKKTALIDYLAAHFPNIR